MYMDAEERKAELMAQNKMSDGRMFKLDFDPRVIGNKILPDGSRKTGIGEFIRKTSLDEFPQFWNVLNGTMSLVGTRPILQDELLKYELHHRARIAIKPGITGMWQVSGRSDITDFEEVVKNHIESQADVTILYKDMKGMPEREISRFTTLELDKENRITDIEVQPYYPKSSMASMDVYVMEKALLESIVDECSARGDRDFVKDALVKKMTGLRIYGYEYTGYTDKIDSLKAYYRNNMNFLNSDIRRELFNSKNPIYTKTKDQSPTKYGSDASVQNSFISDGCVIEGTVINSVLSRGVKVAKGAVIKNSIIMQDSVIEEDVELSHVVFDKEVDITKGRKLIGQESYPLAISKGTKI